MAVSLLDVLVSGRPERSLPEDVAPIATVLAAAVVAACLAGRRAGRRR
jgi:hypothetical protein